MGGVIVNRTVIQVGGTPSSLLLESCVIKYFPLDGTLGA